MIVSFAERLLIERLSLSTNVRSVLNDFLCVQPHCMRMWEQRFLPAAVQDKRGESSPGHCKAISSEPGLGPAFPANKL